ncbi:outer membrane protein assembly factor BamE [Arenibaculum pallidiluteum]|uniref:outer membrane protein assembly factor BamE n=1 Tax=Arenibaculum pallidiluteum TaxID=2812559 RepID=UPI001A968B11|nr:outer membrane protein assembly factor BamE [Arenibaculum pallidiluteum]
MTSKTLLRNATALGLLGLALAACSPTVNTRGNLAEADRLQQIQPGVSTRDQVAALLGSPSSTSTFDRNTWYYIGQRTEQTAFFNPEIIERKVIQIRFDDTGRVQEMKQLDASDGHEVALVERRTPTAGRELGILEQILGNVGRFNNNRGATRPGAPPI